MNFSKERDGGAVQDALDDKIDFLFEFCKEYSRGFDQQQQLQDEEDSRNTEEEKIVEIESEKKRKPSTSHSPDLIRQMMEDSD